MAPPLKYTARKADTFEYPLDPPLQEDRMADRNVLFLENLEWFDETGKEIVHRLPQEGSGEIKWGAQLTVRESQAAVFFYKGKAVGVFGPGRHTLKTANIPILTKIASLPWGMESPLRAEVYFVNLKVFTNLKWGTRDPVAYKDAELGLVRLRAFGVFNIQVVQPVLLINTLVGTQGAVGTDAVEDYLNQVIVSRFNDYMGRTLDSLLNLPARYDELSHGLNRSLEEDLGRFGIRLTELYINAITPPPEVQQAIDDRSRMGVFKDMEKLMQMKAAMAMEKAAAGDAAAASGMGAGLGLMLPAMFANVLTDRKPGPAAAPAADCPECRSAVPGDSKFCPQCGHQLVVFTQCTRCGKNLAPNARFCPRCGLEAGTAPLKAACPACGADNLPGSVFCNECGEKM
jgi:membrane protease subunit (stomatin/prohibitin family)